MIGTTTVVIAEIVITIEENFDDRNRGMPCRTDIVTLVSMLVLPLGISERLKTVQNSHVGHWELNICCRRLVNNNIWELNNNGTVRMIKEFIRQCPACQVMNRMRLQIKTHRFTCASYNPFEVLNIGPLTKDPTGWMNVYHGIIHFW